MVSASLSLGLERKNQYRIPLYSLRPALGDFHFVETLIFFSHDLSTEREGTNRQRIDVIDFFANLLIMFLGEFNNIFCGTASRHRQGQNDIALAPWRWINDREFHAISSRP